MMEWGFWLDAAERTARTVVQAAGAAVLALWIQAGSFAAIDWSALWQAGVFAGGLALLMAVAGKRIGGNTDSASYLEPPE